MDLLDRVAAGPGGGRRGWLGSAATAAVLLAVAAIVLRFAVSGDYAFLRAAVLTGAPSGQYHALGERLAARAARQNGRLRIVPTAGSVENIARLAGASGRCEPAFAFLQDGVPLPQDAGIRTLARLPRPESLLLFARRGRDVAGFDDLRGAKIGIGPDGSGTAFLMRHLLRQPDLQGLGLEPQAHGLDEQARLVRDGALDLAAYVIDENADYIRGLVAAHDLQLVAPSDMEGLVARERWLRLGRIPAGFYDVARPSPPVDRAVAQVDTLVMTNACVARAERLAFLMLLSEEFPSFVRANPPPSARSEVDAPLADEARQFFASGQPELADRYFPWAVNLMSPAYWIYLAMAATVLFNALSGYSRFRLWRIDTNREALEARRAALAASPDPVAAQALLNAYDELRRRCRDQSQSIATPMGSEMFYRYQEALITAAMDAIAAPLGEKAPL